MTKPLSLRATRSKQGDDLRALRQKQYEGGLLSAEDIFNLHYWGALEKNAELEAHLPESELERRHKERITLWDQMIAQGQPPFEIPYAGWRWDSRERCFDYKGARFEVPGLTPKERFTEQEPGRQV